VQKSTGGAPKEVSVAVAACVPAQKRLGGAETCPRKYACPRKRGRAAQRRAQGSTRGRRQRACPRNRVSVGVAAYVLAQEQESVGGAAFQGVRAEAAAIRYFSNSTISGGSTPSAMARATRRRYAAQNTLASWIVPRCISAFLSTASTASCEGGMWQRMMHSATQRAIGPQWLFLPCFARGNCGWLFT